MPSEPPDLLLSGGFLAFARHLGVFQALEEQQRATGAVVGTSSGALMGALWAAGHRPEELMEELMQRRPLSLMGWSWAPWRGLFTLRPLIAWLRERLPARFEELDRPLALGVIDADGQPQLITRGALPEAVAASCAIPHIFQPIWQEGQRWQDGGVADRLMLAPWERWRPGRAAILHWIEPYRAAPDSEEALPAESPQRRILRSPCSGASFWSLGDVEGSVERSRQLSLEAMERW